jgi:large subunit ribosomal protein L15
MKLHDLRPADGSRRPRTRVGRGIAAGKGKTAGRGTKGQRSRAGASIPPWFEGGQTPLHVRIPKLRGFRNPFKTEYEVVNVGRIADLVSSGRLEAPEAGGRKGKSAPVTVNQEILRAAGLVSRLDRPLKVLGHGDVDVAMFVVADAFSRSAVEKIEKAGGTVQVLEVPTAPLAALGVGDATDAPAETAAAAEPEAPAETEAPAATRTAAPKRSRSRAKPASRSDAAAPAVDEMDQAEPATEATAGAATDDASAPTADEGETADSGA